MNEQTQTQPGETKASEKRLRILVVDDSAIARDALCNFLEMHAAFEVVGCAQDGNESLRLAAELRPDLVLMDVNMPGMNGLEATKRLLRQRPDIRVIFVSLHDSLSILRASLATGAHGFVCKNRIHEELLPEISRVFAAPSACHSPTPS